jgi:hypothetical protein
MLFVSKCSNQCLKCNSTTHCVVCDGTAATKYYLYFGNFSCMADCPETTFEKIRT